MFTKNFKGAFYFQEALTTGGDEASETKEEHDEKVEVVKGETQTDLSELRQELANSGAEDVLNQISQKEFSPEKLLEEGPLGPLLGILPPELRSLATNLLMQFAPLFGSIKEGDDSFERLLAIDPELEGKLKAVSYEHRGLSENHAENSRKAIEIAAEQGNVELDVILGPDGEYYISHNLEQGSVPKDAMRFTDMPTLLEKYPTRNFIFDLKSPGLPGIVSQWPEERQSQVTFGAFDIRFLKEAYEKTPKIPRMLHYFPTLTQEPSNISNIVNQFAQTLPVLMNIVSDSMKPEVSKLHDTIKDAKLISDVNPLTDSELVKFAGQLVFTSKGLPPEEVLQYVTSIGIPDYAASKKLIESAKLRGLNVAVGGFNMVGNQDKDTIQDRYVQLLAWGVDYLVPDSESKKNYIGSANKKAE